VTFQVCGLEYDSRSGITLVCTAPAGHIMSELNDPRRFYHSWEWLRRAEEEEEAHEAKAVEEAEESPEIEEAREVVESFGQPEIGDLIDGIVEGDYDPYIESLLAALHGRKRSMRSVPHPYGRTDE
jgi:hypothetical protein